MIFIFVYHVKLIYVHYVAQVMIKNMKLLNMIIKIIFVKFITINLILTVKNVKKIYVYIANPNMKIKKI